ncbi:unnamed protein product [Mytilus coruscus]|uniref:Uncharacterized protein n=1 Tax=Mytilus coruscus TaxID=42192 RepID=A0A6J8EQW6_MYTCO|nr:unnamed protein product [Mytilus coruscus]
MDTVRDDVKSTEFCTTITSGSFGEGLELRGSDLDMMEVIKRFEAYADEKIRFNPNLIYFRMETDDVKPGFTQLLVKNTDNQDLLKLCEELNGKHFFSSALFKQCFLANNMITDGRTFHGPCIYRTKPELLTKHIDCIVKHGYHKHHKHHSG